MQRNYPRMFSPADGQDKDGFNDFLQQYYSNSLGAGALNKPFWAYKETPWYINLFNYFEFAWLCPICRYLFIKVLYKTSNS